MADCKVGRQTLIKRPKLEDTPYCDETLIREAIQNSNILVLRESVGKVIIKSSVLKKTAAWREDPVQADGERQIWQRNTHTNSYFSHTHSQIYWHKSSGYKYSTLGLQLTIILIINEFAD